MKHFLLTTKPNFFTMKNSLITSRSTAGKKPTAFLHRFSTPLFYTRAMIVAFIMYSTVAFSQVTNCDCDHIRFDDGEVTTSSQADGFVFDCTIDKYKLRVCNDNLGCPAENVVIRVELPVGIVPTNLNGFTDTHVQTTKQIGNTTVVFNVFTKTISIAPNTCIDDFIEGKGEKGGPNASTLSDEILFLATIQSRTTGTNTCTDEILGESSTFAYHVAQELFGNGSNFLVPPTTVTASLVCDPVFNAGRTYVITDNLTLSAISNTNYCINDGKIFVKPNVGIIITNGAILNIHASVFRSCGNEMWEGIKVDNGALLHTDNVVQGGGLGTGKMEIHDAKNAINAKSGSFAIIKETKFIDNYIGVKQDGADQVIIEKKTSFTGTGKLKPATGLVVGTLPYTGILAINNSFVSVSNSTFTNLANGIDARTSSVNVSSSTFTDMKKLSSYNLAGYGIHVNNGSSLRTLSSSSVEFKNCEETTIRATGADISVIGGKISTTPIGILAQKSGLLHVENVKDFDAAHQGINATLNRSISMNIVNNKFINGRNIGIGLRFNTYAQRGVIRNNDMNLSGTAAISSEGPNLGRSFEIRNNPAIHFRGTDAIKLLAAENVTINNNPDINLFSGLRGVFVSGGSRNNVNCNIVTNRVNSQAGMRFDMITSPIVSCNQINSPLEATGVRFDATSVDAIFNMNVMQCTNPMANVFGQGLFLTDNAIIGEQPYRGNCWVSSGANNNNLGNFGASRFTVFTQTTPLRPCFMPSYRDPIDWFRNIPLSPPGSQDDCTTTSCTIRPPLAGGEHIVGRIFTEGITSGSSPVTATWIMRRQYFDILKENPIGLAQNTSAANLMQQLEQGDIGHLYAIAVQMNTLYKGTAVQEDVKQALIAQISSLSNQITTIEESISNTSENSSLLQQRKQLVQQLRNLYTQRDANEATIQQEVDNKIMTLNTQNESINVELLPAQNEKAMNKLYLKAIAKEEVLNNAEISTLTSIAFQCAYQGGDAVFRARAMYDYLVGEANYPEDCEGRIAPKMQANGNDNQTILYPNPAGDYVMLNMPESDYNKLLSITFINAQGAIVLKQPVNAVERINTANLASGFYTCIVRDNATGATLNAQKIIINKN